MVALSERKIEIVRRLVEAAPDRVVGGLQAALAETPDGSALAGVRRLVESEARDRALRNAVLLPVVPMFVAAASDPNRLTFPSRALPLIWRGLKAMDPEGVEDAAAALVDYLPGESSNEPFDVLLQAAAEALRGRRTHEFAQAAEACEAARPDGASRLAQCLDIGPVVRMAVPRLADWSAHFGEETTASTRLAYKDAVAISEDAGQCFFEMIAAHMPYPWMVLRIISSVMDKPTERYLADSEMAMFGERVMAEIEATLASVARLQPDAGAAAGRSAAKDVELITLQISEMETCIDLSRDHGWGHDIGAKRKALAAVAEAHLRTTEKLVLAAMPTQVEKIGRIRKTVPRLNAMPDPTAIRRAMTLLTFTNELRTSANYGGFAAARGKLLEVLGDMLDNYVEETLDHLRTGDVADEGVAYAFLELAADVSLLVRDERAAELVRRRAAASRHNDAPPAEAQAS